MDDEELYGLPGLPQLPHLPSLRKKKPKYPALPPAEEKSLLSDVLGSGTSALQYIGETLDKPGRMIRGMMTGNIRELGNAIPFSDTLGITDPSTATSGKDLLQHIGLQDKLTPEQENQLSGWERFGRGAAGFGTEVVTDPASYLTFGASAIGKAGKAAKAAGLSLKGAERAKTLEQALVGATLPQVKAAVASAKAQGTTLKALRGEQLGGAFGLSTGPLGLLGISGTHVPEIAKSPGAFKALEGITGAPEKLTRMIPGVGDALADLGSGVKTFGKGLFHAPSMGIFNKEGQAVAEHAYAGKQAAATLAKYNSLKAADAADEISKAMHETFGSTLGTTPEETSQRVRAAMQMAGEVQRSGGRPAVARGIQETMPGIAVGSKIRKPMEDVVNLMKSGENKIYDKAIDMGADWKKMFEDEAQSPLGHFFRGLDLSQLSPRAKHELRQMKLLGTGFEATIGRTPEIAHIPAPVMNKIVTDTAMQGMKQSDVVQHLLANYGEHITRAAKSSGVQESQRALASGSTAPLKNLTPANVADELATYITGKNAKMSGKQGPMPKMFVEDAVQNYGRYEAKGQAALANFAGTHSYLNQNVVPLGTPGTVPLSQVFQDAKFVVPKAEQFFGKRFGKNAAQLAVPQDVAQGVASFMSKSQKPEWMHQLGDTVDWLTEPFKRNVTLPFPSFMTRNFTSGQWMNFQSGEIPDIQHLMKYKDELSTARQILNDPAQHKALLNELHAHGVFDMAHLESGGVALGGPHSLPNPVSLGGIGQNFSRGAGTAMEAAMAGGAPTKAGKVIKGAAGAPAAVGAEFNKQVEFMNRVPMYLYLRKHLGWTAEAAASKVRQLQVDYADLAPFEKDVMKRLVPFYTWQRKIVPVMLSQMAQRPGGVAAQTVRASNIGRSKDEFVPPYVGEGMSVNLGGDKYLSGLGLPTDQLADLFVKGPTALGTLKRTGQKALSQMNPLVKGPLEIATGVNTFTGRPIEEAFPYPTKSVLMNQVIHNTPAARAATTMRQIEDMQAFGGRKAPISTAANLLTGARITDVSGGLEREKRLAEGKMLQELLREDPNIASSTDVYVKKDQKTGQPLPLSEETEKRLRALMTLKKRAADEAKKKKKRLAAGLPAM